MRATASPRNAIALFRLGIGCLQGRLGGASHRKRHLDRLRRGHSRLVRRVISDQHLNRVVQVSRSPRFPPPPTLPPRRIDPVENAGRGVPPAYGLDAESLGVSPEFSYCRRTLATSRIADFPAQKIGDMLLFRSFPRSAAIEHVATHPAALAIRDMSQIYACRRTKRGNSRKSGMSPILCLMDSLGPDRRRRLFL
jgi:hypothetical protein